VAISVKSVVLQAMMNELYVSFPSITFTLVIVEVRPWCGNTELMSSALALPYTDDGHDHIERSSLNILKAQITECIRGEERKPACG
jgi:hypothetical protein